MSPARPAGPDRLVDGPARRGFTLPAIPRPPEFASGSAMLGSLRAAAFRRGR